MSLCGPIHTLPLSANRSRSNNSSARHVRDTVVDHPNDYRNSKDFPLYSDEGNQEDIQYGRTTTFTDSQYQHSTMSLDQPVRMDHRDHSAFGDAYSVNSRKSSYSDHRSSRSLQDDEPEADYDRGATELYSCIEHKDWDGALNRLELAPVEAKTWVLRREHDGSSKVRWRLLPHHAVCIFRAPLALIEALIEVYPDGPQMKDDQGMLPVHLACRNGASKGVVLTLLDAFPDSIFIRDRKKRSPLDLVEASESANKEAVISAMKRFQRDLSGREEAKSGPSHTIQHSQPAPPVAASNVTPSVTPRSYAQSDRSHISAQESTVAPEVDYEHRTTLFKMILKKDWKTASSRAVNHSEEAGTWIVTKGFNGNLRFLPLHKACVLNPPESIINALLASYPEGSRDTDQDGWLPIHCACFYGANEKIVDALLTANPKGTLTKDDDGRLPLHYACLKGASKAVVDVLLASYAKGALIKDGEGRLPIHHACSKGASDPIIEALLKTAPKGAQSKDDQGRLALHHACRKNASERVIRTLLRVYPRASQIKDDQDKLPIHYTCQHGAATSVVQLLLQTYPESINAKNGFGLTPLAEAKMAVKNSSEAGNSTSKLEVTVRLLEKAKRDLDKKRRGQEGSTTSEEEGNEELQSTVHELQNKINHLEKTLSKVTILGKEMKNDIKRNKDPSEMLNKFSQALIEIGSRSTSGPTNQQNKAPGKRGGVTPLRGRGLFGRNRNNKQK